LNQTNQATGPTFALDHKAKHLGHSRDSAGQASHPRPLRNNPRPCRVPGPTGRVGPCLPKKKLGLRELAEPCTMDRIGGTGGQPRTLRVWAFSATPATERLSETVARTCVVRDGAHRGTNCPPYGKGQPSTSVSVIPLLCCLCYVIQFSGPWWFSRCSPDRRRLTFPVGIKRARLRSVPLQSTREAAILRNPDKCNAQPGKHLFGASTNQCNGFRPANQIFVTLCPATGT